MQVLKDLLQSYQCRMQISLVNSIMYLDPSLGIAGGSVTNYAISWIQTAPNITNAQFYT